MKQAYRNEKRKSIANQHKKVLFDIQSKSMYIHSYICTYDVWVSWFINSTTNVDKIDKHPDMFGYLFNNEYFSMCINIADFYLSSLDVTHIRHSLCF